jgi:hypothetical protein
MAKKLVLLIPLCLLLGTPAAPAAPVPKAGDMVWAQWRPNDWYHGKATKACPIGLHVVFDDSDEADVPVSLMALDQAPKKTEVKVGSRVLAQRNDGRLYPGTVTKAADGKYDVQHDDSETATVGLAQLRLLAVNPMANRTAKAGDKVWAQWRPNDWYHGKVSKACPTGLHVVFDDGDEADLSVTLIGLDQAPKKNEVKVGSRVLAQWTDGKLYPGTVTKLADGKYDILFDDSDTTTVGLGQILLLNE